MIHIVTALMAEARPIVERLGLRASAQRPFRVFAAEDIELVVCGIGTSAAATAVGYAGANSGRGSDAWLNVGIAGHRDAEPGRAGIAHKIVDRSSGRSWYPPAPFDPPCSGFEVRTVPQVEREFEGDALYDMEAAGFYPAALRFATSEVVQVLKVVSDNRKEAPERLTAASVAGLIEARLPEVEALLGALRELSDGLSVRLEPPTQLAAFLEARHFTVSQERQLERLLRRRAALGRLSEPTGFAPEASAREVLAALRKEL